MSDSQAKGQAEAARSIFAQALAACTVAEAFAAATRREGSVLDIQGSTYDLSRHSGIILVAIGKAGATMFDAMAALLPAGMACRGVVVSPAPPQLADGVQWFAGGHPEPNAASLAAARAVLAAVEGAAQDALIVFLISGGASSMCELPLDDGICLEDLRQLYRVLVGSGATIAEINCIRKHFSGVKGGRLAVAAGERTTLTLLVSDVPSGTLDALGSGPTLADATTVEDCVRLLARYDLTERLPASLLERLQQGLPETPKASHPAFANGATHVLLENESLLQAAAAAAADLGYETLIDSGCDEWPYEQAAEYLLHTLAPHCVPGLRFCLISGGEMVVKLHAQAGQGGRNQQFVLACALRGLPPGVTVLSAGSDGIDGNSPAAGAVADHTTLTRASAAGCAATRHLAAFNAYPVFEAVHDSIHTQPTGNNLRDLRLLLWDGLG